MILHDITSKTAFFSPKNRIPPGFFRIDRPSPAEAAEKTTGGLSCFGGKPAGGSPRHTDLRGRGKADPQSGSARRRSSSGSRMQQRPCARVRIPVSSHSLKIRFTLTRLTLVIPATSLQMNRLVSQTPSSFCRPYCPHR